jgi:RNA polymerase sigma-70 factor, ECF subfamily
MTDWPAIVRQHTPTVWTAVYRILGSHADAADAFQETFNAAVALERRQPIRNWDATLTHLATTRAIDLLRKRIRNHRRLQKLQTLATPATESDPRTEAEDRELLMHLRTSIADLPPKQAETYCLRYIHQWTYEQIAAEHNMTVNAVGVLLNATRTRLTESMSKHIAKNEVKHET